MPPPTTWSANISVAVNHKDSQDEQDIMTEATAATLSILSILYIPVKLRQVQRLAKS